MRLGCVGGRGAVRAGVRRLHAARRGVAALEYGLIAGLMAVALIVGASQLGTTLNRGFQLAGLFFARF